VLLAQSEDPREILVQLRAKVLDTVRSLPKFMCTETVERYRYRSDFRRHLAACDQPSTGDFAPKRELSSSDRLRLDVAIAPTREIFSWHGADRFDDRDLLDMVDEGAVSTGEFGAFLSDIFVGDAATFTYNGDSTDERGRALSEFGFRVPREKSGNYWGRKGNRTVTGYDGTMLVDTGKLDLVRLTIRTERLPEETQACEATTTLNFGHVEIHGYDFLLPAEARLRVVQLDGGEAENVIAYSGCHVFRAESQVSFDEALPVAESAKPAAIPPALALPAGLPFKTKLTSDIDTAKAAAGDPVKLRLAAALGSRPAGSTIHARIMRVQHSYGKIASVTVTIRLETVEIGGFERPFPAASAPPVERFQAGSVSFTRQRAELGSLDSMEPRTGQLFAIEAKADHVFKAGTEMNWLTARP
jgi:hypothetical protein